jgi:hypothetical protein
MEEKINIAEILKNKSQGTKLYSILSDGECFLNEASEDSISIDIDNRKRFWCFTVYGSTHSFPNGCVLLFPSKEMRDWAKFAWKKGDVLSCGVDNLCIFEKWANEEYTEFYAKFVTPNYSGNTFKTEKWSKETNEAVIKQYISNIEEFKGGKLNLTTLEIEKQPEFKDGDIVVYGKSVAICRKIYKHTLSFYVSLNEMFGLLFADEVESSEEYRFATEEEKQQLFDALEKEGKAWDSEKKQIVDLPKKCEFKPFDKVLCRNSKDDTWEADFFARLTRKEIDYTQSDKYLCVGDLWMYCIPYNEETAHLLGTTDEWKGGEG